MNSSTISLPCADPPVSAKVKDLQSSQEPLLRDTRGCQYLREPASLGPRRQAHRIVGPVSLLTETLWRQRVQSRIELVDGDQYRPFDVLKPELEVILLVGQSWQMNADIVAKLNHHLSEPIDTECAVVYLLAEVRKLLEKDKPDPKPVALLMYCHWALHVDLKYARTTLDFLKKVDIFVRNTVSGFQSDGAYTFQDDHELLKEFLYLETFRKQLRDCLDSYDLPTNLCDDNGLWSSFISAYAGVIEDGSLSSGAGVELQAISSVTFSKGAPLSSESHVPFEIQWDIQLVDGRKLTAELTAKQDLSMWSSGLSLAT